MKGDGTRETEIDRERDRERERGGGGGVHTGMVRWLVTQLRSGRREKWRNDCLTCTV